MSLETRQLFESSSTPTPTRVGDFWINDTGAQVRVYICTALAPGGTGTWTPLSQVAPYIGVLGPQTILKSAFTDGGSTAGTYVMTGALPLGAMPLYTKVLVNTGFSGDTSAALIIGDGSDTDRYNTSTIDVFTTAATGVQAGIVSGFKLLTAANSPTLTVTSGADFTNVASAGSITVSVFYLATV